MIGCSVYGKARGWRKELLRDLKLTPRLNCALTFAAGLGQPERAACYHEILAPFLDRDPDLITFTDYEGL